MRLLKHELHSRDRASATLFRIIGELPWLWAIQTEWDSRMHKVRVETPQYTDGNYLRYLLRDSQWKQTHCVQEIRAMWFHIVGDSVERVVWIRPAFRPTLRNQILPLSHGIMAHVAVECLQPAGTIIVFRPPRGDDSLNRFVGTALS